MQEDENRYRAGVQNIGTSEISVRKKFLYFFGLTTGFFTVWSFLYCDSVLCWGAMLLSSFALSVLFFEVKYHFCILFGYFSLFNFGKLGNLQEATRKEDALKDRRRTLQITILSLLIATCYSSAIHWMAMLITGTGS